MHLKVAIVILNFNGVRFLERFLPSVLATTYENLSIVVADNASTDHSIAFVQTHFPSVSVIVNDKNEGFAGGYNWALQHVQAEYYVLLNSDVEVTPQWIQPMVDLLESDHTIGACQPKILSFDNPDMFEYAGAAGGWIDHLGYPFSKGRVFDICEKDVKQYNTALPIFWASGAALCIRAKLFHSLGGFDADFFAHQEEIDLCWRMQLKDYHLYSCPMSTVFHVGGGTLPRGGKKVFLNFRNNLIMMTKNLPFNELIWKLPFRIGLDAISAWKGLFTGDIAFFSAIIFAHLGYIKYVFKGKIKRTQHTKPMKSLDGVYGGSLVWDYFVRNRRYFDKIVRQTAS